MKKIIIFCICFLIAINSYAQTVIKLKDGTRVEGKLVEKTDDYIKVDAFGVTLTYRMDDIEGVQSERGVDVPIDEMIVIKGRVIFDDWKQGYIRIMILDSPPGEEPDIINSTYLLRPGPYTIAVPPRTIGSKGIVYVIGYNDIDDDGFPFQLGHDPTLGYGINPRTPIVLDKQVTKDIDLYPSRRE